MIYWAFCFVFDSSLLTLLLSVVSQGYFVLCCLVFACISNESIVLNCYQKHSNFSIVIIKKAIRISHNFTIVCLICKPHFYRGNGQNELGFFCGDVAAYCQENDTIPNLLEKDNRQEQYSCGVQATELSWDLCFASLRDCFTCIFCFQKFK